MNHKGAWPIKVHPLAIKDLDRMKRDNPRDFAALMTGLKLLAQESNPYEPRNRQLNVCRTYPDARECMRVKIRGEHWRAVLRVIEVSGGFAYVMEADEQLSERADNAYLQLVFADSRSDNTYVQLADRYLAVTGA